MAGIIPGKLIYLAHARTASQATCEAIARVPSGYRTQIHHLKLAELDVEKKGALVVTCVRNHFEVLMSWWLAVRYQYADKYWDFDRFLYEWPLNEKKHVQGHRLFALHSPAADVVMRYERLQQDFDAVMDRIDEARMQIPMHNRTKDKDRDWRRFFKPRHVVFVKSYFKTEMEELGYDF